jgi:hypothetical protein
MLPKKQRRYIIEYSFDKNHREWFAWDGRQYLSYVQAKDEVNKLAIKEQEYNSNATEPKSQPYAISGFRIIEEYIETKTSILAEVLF